jgi:hypothetical protein
MICPVQDTIALNAVSDLEGPKEHLFNWMNADLRKFKFYCCVVLTPWNRVLPDKLIVAQLVKKFVVFYGT